MNVVLSYLRVDDAVRARTLFAAFALIASAAGVFAANAGAQVLLIVGLVLVASVAALTVPSTALTPVLAAFVPFQSYFFIPGTNYTIRAAVIFVALAAARLLVGLGIRSSVRGWTWIAPCAVFLFAAFVAAFGAPNEYQALKGIYEWLPIVACIFIAAHTVRSARTFSWIILILVAGGTLQAILGLAEYIVGLDRITIALASPLGELFMQPNLLQERLGDLYFNWILSGRAVPFGTFINAIDYAIFLAAILLLALAYAFSQCSRSRFAFWLGCALVMGAALLLTLKGSGYVALFGGAIALAVRLAPRWSRRTLTIALAICAVAILIASPFVGSISERAVFLIQREREQSQGVGRLRIWLNLLPSFMQRPLFGYGLNSSEFLADPTRTLRGGAFALNPTSPESAYVEMLIETGALGTIALMSLFGVTLVRVYRRAREGADAVAYGGVFAALVAVLLGNLTVSGFTTDQNGMLMGILIGLVFAEWKAP